MTKSKNQNPNKSKKNQIKENISPICYCFRFIWILSFVVWICIGISFAVPAKVFLNIPFAPQAPFGNWSHMYNEACEEASIVMALKYAKRKGITRLEMDHEIKGLVKFQEKEYGGHFDLTIEKTAQLLKDYYGFNRFQVIQQASIETIIGSLANKNPIILPMAGRLLGNPYFRRPGPVYHMIVIKGYDLEKREFITNDPGTRRGLNYRYSFEVIEKAWGDWKTGNRSLILVKY